MSLLEWLQFLYDLCTSDAPPANWRAIAVFSNAAIALAYFWIPLTMAVVFSRWRQELPYPWLWAGFVTFITACGASHVMHAFHALRDQSAHTAFELTVLVGTAVVSLVTAAGFTFLLPSILRLASPSEARRNLQNAVETATHELRGSVERQRILLLEVHHRVKNNLQVTTSLINLHLRKFKGGDAGNLKALRERIMAMAIAHSQLQQVSDVSVQVTPFLRSIARSVAEARGRPVGAIKISGDDFEVPLDHAVSFALIMHEVIASAFPEAASGSRSVEVETALDSGSCMVTIALPAPNADGAQEDEVSRSLVSTLTVQLNATSDWSTLPDGRRHFALHFPAFTGVNAPDRTPASA